MLFLELRREEWPEILIHLHMFILGNSLKWDYIKEICLTKEWSEQHLPP
jgi:hypothetical protein